MTADNGDGREPTNATQAELEELNGLLVRELIAKLRDGTARGTDLATASKLLISNRVRPTDPEAEEIIRVHTIDPDDFPVKV